jgi:hypothetical protein
MGIDSGGFRPTAKSPTPEIIKKATALRQELGIPERVQVNVEAALCGKWWRGRPPLTIKALEALGRGVEARQTGLNGDLEATGITSMMCAIGLVPI